MNFFIARARRAYQENRTVFRTKSAFSGEIEVRDCGRERLLLINGEAHSLHFTTGRWSEAGREYWGYLARTPFSGPDHPEILMLGLGGGTTIRLMQNSLKPESLTVVELDPAVISTAREYFGIESIRGVSILQGDALQVMEKMVEEGLSYDIVVDDVYFTITSMIADQGAKIIGSMMALLRPGGTLILNRPVDNTKMITLHHGLAGELRERGNEIVIRTIRGRWWNDIIYCRKQKL